MSDKSAKKLETIRALLAKADGTDFPEEAEAFRSKADALMTAYAIEQWQLDALEDADRASKLPVSRDVNINWWMTSPLKDQLWSLLLSVARHCRISVVPHAVQWHGNKPAVPVVGLESDLDYFDMLFSSLYLQLGKQLEPTYSDILTLEENVAVFKEAGLKWQRIAQLIGRPDYVQADGKVKDGGAMVRLYKKWCTDNDMTPVKANPAMYQRSFAGGYVTGVRTQLEKQEQEQGQSKGSMALVIRDIRDTIDAAAEEMYGKDKSVRRYRRDTRKQDYAARAAGTKAGEKADVAVHTGRRVANNKQLEG